MSPRGSDLPALKIEGTLYEDENSNESENHLSHEDAEDSQSDEESSKLHMLLRNHAIPHSGPHVTSFWSIQRLHEIMTPERILAQLESKNIPRDNARLITAKYMRMYAILILNEMDGNITALMQEGIDDSCLPLVKADLAKHKNAFQMARSDRKQMPLACFKSWKIAERESFLTCQYRFIPAVLEFKAGTKTIQHLDFKDAVVLPFSKSRPIREGGYGSVTETEVHPDCHGFQDVLKSITINNKFAVKKLLYAQNDKEFRNEVDALKRFNGFVHEHLVTLLMTWTRHGHYNFLFPLAGCNLEDFWRKHSPWEIRDIIDVPAVQWISKQVLGLAGAVDTVHNPSHHLGQDRKYGRHGDLKPENILWYQSPKHPRGILVIADLGLSSVNTEKSRSNIPNQGIPFTPGYRPPECDLEGGTISRSYDIWTFGCLLLELVSCALGGNKARVDFENKRMSPYITGSKSDIFFDVRRQDGGPDYVVMVKECVSQWIASLHEMSTCTQYFHDLLDLIERDMVVTLSQDQVRCTSSQVFQKVKAMHDRVMEPSDGYCRDTKPEKRFPKICIPVQANLNATAKGEIARRRPNLAVYGGKKTRKSKTREQLSSLY